MNEKLGYNDDGTFTPIRRGQYAPPSIKVKKPDVRQIALDKLAYNRNHPFQIYGDERLEKLAEDIEANGLDSPILVRPIEGDRYEILSGHNRFEAVKKLGWNEIDAIIKMDVSDEKAERIVIGANLNQQSFADWNYSQQIRVIKIYSKYIQENSQQGKRTDLAVSKTCVQSEHMSEGEISSPRDRKPDGKPPKRPTARDKISKQLGISTPAFQRYRSIAKLEGDTLDTVCTMLDEKKLRFMGAVYFSQLKPGEQLTVLSILKRKPEITAKGSNLKLLSDKSRNLTAGELSREEIKETLLSDIVSS